MKCYRCDADADYIRKGYSLCKSCFDLSMEAERMAIRMDYDDYLESSAVSNIAKRLLSKVGLMWKPFFSIKN